MDKAGWEIVFSTGNQVEAELMRGLLVTSDIPVVMEATGLKAMPIFFGHAAVGDLVLKVPPDLAELAAQLLAAEIEAEPEPESE